MDKERPFIFNPEGRCIHCRDRIFEGFRLMIASDGVWLICPRCKGKQRTTDKLKQTTRVEEDSDGR